MTRVIDASVAVKWVLPTEALSDRARALLDDGDPMVAPDLLAAEAANVLWRKTVHRDLSPADAMLALHAITGGLLDLQPTTSLVPRALALACELRHRVYDCLYLALAEERRCPLVTADARLAALDTKRIPGVRIVSLSSL